MLTGKHLIAGAWLPGPSEFQSSPATGDPRSFFNASDALVAQAALAAQDAFAEFSRCERSRRAAFLDEIAKQLELRAADIVAVAMAESGLPEARLKGELGRTTGQLRLFAECVTEGAFLERTITTALPDRQPLPRPEMRLMMRALGPVAVFGASNFPLAFSTAGGDTASAFAAVCPVIVKGHPAHPGTSEIVAQAIQAAIAATAMPAGVFALLQDAGHDVAKTLVQHPQIRAVGFTGSLAAGRTLFNLCAQRPDPVPFFGELGSINPSFLLPGALANRGEAIAQGWAASLALGAGQFCTNPGVFFVHEGEGVASFLSAASDALSSTEAQTMLTDGIAASCETGADVFASLPGVKQIVFGRRDGRAVSPSLFTTNSRAWQDHSELGDEVFGPVGVLVTVDSDDEMFKIAEGLSGQLTASVHLDESDEELAARLLPILEQKAGRLLANGFPTGVEVDAAMMHGGPYPASTNAATTSVGTLAIRRFLRPVCYQGIPEVLLPADLRGA